MTKILKPYTIIPSELYVQRDADKQVRNIINDMGRPGYVLVSRQMGKTNLLLNAKRVLETPNDVFLYVDLSNTFPNSRSCFENIINTALDTYSYKFGGIMEEIFERRKLLVDTPPHKQHTNELRMLLRELNGGKLVIILDEIDALIKTDYSDQIFSQIRSSYFASRVNYTEFYNLTYLLSGVIEPNEIIKDPKISPFNIGQKIYLNDFSKQEFEQFLKLAALTFDEKVIDRIFHWTHGNPRMTWDLCSEIENYQKKEQIEVSTIDKIVNQLYLISFDKPPIDNIRELVMKDKDIRNSIIEIEYHKGKQISDKNKSKLYLAGIINYVENDDVKIKNPIIRQSLNYDWIRSIEEQEKGLINLAMEAYQNNRYTETLSIFEKYLENNEFPETIDTPHYYYIMGHCASSARSYSKALNYYNKAEYNVDEEAIWYYKTMCQKGLMYYYLGQLENSLKCYKEVIANWKKDESYLKALINYGSITLKAKNSQYNEEAISIFHGITSDTFDKEKIKESFLREVKTIAYYNLAQTYRLNNVRSLALKNLREALIIALEQSKPKVLISLLELTDDIKEQEELIVQMNKVLEITIEVKQDEQDNSLAFSKEDLAEFLIIMFARDVNQFSRIYKNHLSKISEKSYAGQLAELAIYAINRRQQQEIALKIIRESYNSLSQDEINSTKYEIYRLSAMLMPSEIKELHISEYLELFKHSRPEKIDLFDFDIFIKLIMRFLSVNNYQKALECIDTIEAVRSTVEDYLLINYAVIYHIEYNIYNTLGLFFKAKVKAGNVVNLLNTSSINQFDSILIKKNDKEFIRSSALEFLQPQPLVQPIINKRNYERNEKIRVRYKDGSIVEDKFKRLQSDIEANRCFILN